MYQMQLHDMLHRVRTLMQDHSASPQKSIPDQPEKPLLLNRRSWSEGTFVLV